MTITPPQVKEPAEILDIPVDFTANVPSGGSISTAVITANDKLTGTLTTATIVSGAASINGSIVTQRIVAGAHGEQHVLTWTITYSTGSKTVDELLLVIDQGMVA